jgi:nucleotide-binding universal stress UspA family protein
MAAPEGRADPIVLVGIDGSEHSLDALRWAARYARAVGALLRPIVAWSHPAYTDFVEVPAEEYEPVARADLEDALHLLRSEFSDVAIDPQVVYGLPAAVLIDASKDADLLVVGTRGHGGFTGMLLGSVSQHCVHHAACPVVVVVRQGREAS